MKKILNNIIKKYKMQSLKNIKSFYEDIKELFNSDFLLENLDKIATACIIRKSKHFISNDDISCLTNPYNHIVKDWHVSPILKTISRF